jgi:hypothetical protein
MRKLRVYASHGPECWCGVCVDMQTEFAWFEYNKKRLVEGDNPRPGV